MRTRPLLSIAALALGCTTALASPAEGVIAPDIERGEREFEFAFGTERNRDGKPTNGLELSFGAGVTERWATELGLEFEREPGDDMKYDGLEWENRFGLLIDEEAPVALSLLLGFERPRERAEGWSSTLGLLSETKVGRFLLNANLLLERSWNVRAEEDRDDAEHEDGDEDDEEHEGDEADADATHALGEDDDDEESGTVLGYQWQLLYRHSHSLYYGVQGMGEVGKWNDWAPHDDQEHKLGPAIFGRMKTAGGQRLNYDVGLLFGVTDGTPDYTLRFKLEYEL